MACRRRATQGELLRFMVGEDDTLRFDGRLKMGGRGAWLCKSKVCLSRAIKNRSFQRALKRPLKAPMENALIEQLSAVLLG